MELNQIQSSALNWGEAANSLNQNFSKIGTDMEKMKYATTRNKGYFSSVEALKAAVESANLGDIAYVKVEGFDPYEVWEWTSNGWIGTGVAGGDESIDLGDYYNKEDVDTKFENHKVKMATDEVLGGIIAAEREDTDVTEVKIDPETGRLYTAGVTVEGDIAPDEEDLTATIEEGKAVVRFRDRGSKRGKGYVILRANKPIFEQMTQENTIYEIRYDFDLGGGNLEVPANCTLDFKGGSIINGTTSFNNTLLINDIKILTNLKGNIANDYVNVTWFGAYCNGETDDSFVWNEVVKLQSDINNNFYIIFSGISVINNPINITSNKCIIKGVTPKSSILTSKTNNIIILNIEQEKNDLFSGKTTLCNFGIDGTNCNDIIGIYAKHIHSSYMENIEFHHLYKGIVLDECTLNTFVNFFFQYTSNSIETVSWSNFNQFVGGIVRGGNLADGLTRVIFTNFDFEPISKTIVLDNDVKFYHCRFEAFTRESTEYYKWFIINGNNNFIDDSCQFHWDGSSLLHDYLMEINGSNNNITISSPYSRTRLVKFGDNATKNIISIYKSDPYKNTGYNERFKKIYNIADNIGDNIVEFKEGSTKIQIQQNISTIVSGAIKLFGFNPTIEYRNCSKDGWNPYYTKYGTGYAVNAQGGANGLSRVVFNTGIVAPSTGFYTVSAIAYLIGTTNIYVGLEAGGELQNIGERKYTIVHSSLYLEEGAAINVYADTWSGTGFRLYGITISEGVTPVICNTLYDKIVTSNDNIDSYEGGTCSMTDITISNSSYLLTKSGRIGHIKGSITFSSATNPNNQQILIPDVKMKYADVTINSFGNEFSSKSSIVDGNLSVMDGKTANGINFEGVVVLI